MNPQPSQQPAHSPLPWHLDETKRFVYASNDGELVAAILLVTGSPRASIANADLVLRVNSHQALVDALTKCVTWAETYARRQDIVFSSTGPLATDIKQAREALRSATQ